MINHLANGVAAEDIVMGAMVSLGGRAIQLMRPVGLEPGYMLTGGMTRNEAMVGALEAALGSKFHVPPNGLGQLNGAYGAAFLGMRRLDKLLAEGRPIPKAASQEDPAPARAGEGGSPLVGDDRNPQAIRTVRRRRGISRREVSALPVRRRCAKGAFGAHVKMWT